MFELRGRTADELFSEACWKFKHRAYEEESRNGRVLTIQEPSVIELRSPKHRILFNDVRDANPFFHMMEAIWMWAGRDDVEWIQQFNKGIAQFAEEDGHFHGAYGWRWRNLFDFDQLIDLASNIELSPTSRQHVLQMWTGDYDADPRYKDIPCNTQIMFRVVKGNLEMTVINRSNDLVWGALGANIVHMTMLHELMALTTGLKLGIYRVLSNNLHLYERHWDLLNGAVNADKWKFTAMDSNPRPLDHERIDMEAWLGDAEAFCHGYTDTFVHPWFYDVAQPMKRAYLDKQHRGKHINEIKCPAWQEAARLWTERRK